MGPMILPFKRPDARATGILRIKAEGTVLSGSYEAHEKTQPLTGSIKGNNLIFYTAVGDPPQQIKLEFKGTVSDNEITGTARANDSEPSVFKGIRVNP